MRRPHRFPSPGSDAELSVTHLSPSLAFARAHCIHTATTSCIGSPLSIDTRRLLSPWTTHYIITDPTPLPFIASVCVGLSAPVCVGSNEANGHFAHSCAFPFATSSDFDCSFRIVDLVSYFATAHHIVILFPHLWYELKAPHICLIVERTTCTLKHCLSHHIVSPLFVVVSF